MDKRKDIPWGWITGGVLKRLFFLYFNLCDAPEKVESVKIDFIMHGFQAAYDFFIHVQPVVWLAEPHLCQESFEVWLFVERRFIPGFLHHVGINGWENLILEVIPESFEVGFEWGVQ